MMECILSSTTKLYVKPEVVISFGNRVIVDVAKYLKIKSICIGILYYQIPVAGFNFIIYSIH